MNSERHLRTYFPQYQGVCMCVSACVHASVWYVCVYGCVCVCVHIHTVYIRIYT